MKYTKFLKRYIPSADVRKKILAIGHSFSDWDKAAIIWNSNENIRDSIEGIREIADMTSDEILREQILERIEYELDKQRLFYEYATGFIYVLNSHENEEENEDCIIGYFADGKAAYDVGCKLGFAFDVTKYQIIKADSIRKEDLDDIRNGIAQIEYDKSGEAYYSWSKEIQQERRLKIESTSNKRFENKYVIFPEVFKEFEKVRVIGDKECIGWVFNGHMSHECLVKRATAPDSMSDYIDASLGIDFWNEESLMWDHKRVLPIYLERVQEDLCNSFDEEGANQVIVGHDKGAALWFRVVDVKESDKIMFDDVSRLGMEISVHESFFDVVLLPVFLDVFDREMTINKNRFTYGLLHDEGEYIHRFEERVLEYNFFTYEQMNEVLNRIDDMVRDGVCRIEKAINGTDAIQLVTFTSHIRHIMEYYPERNIISVLS